MASNLDSLWQQLHPKMWEAILEDQKSWCLWYCQAVVWNVSANVVIWAQYVMHCSNVCVHAAEQWPKGTPHCRLLWAYKEYTENNPNFISTITNGGGPWVYGYDPEMKQQASQRKMLTSPQPKKAQQIWNSVKSVLIWGGRGHWRHHT
jgi:hypothetical protein